MATATDILDFARGEIGYSRWTDPEEGTKYGRWYAQETGEEWAGASGIAYCVMFVSYVFHFAGQNEPFLPNQNCDSVVREARAAGALVDPSDAQAGDLVIFDWGDGGILDHIGIIESRDGNELVTIEGNTLNGQVARRERTFDYVQYVVRPSYYENNGWIYEPLTDQWWYKEGEGWPRNAWRFIDGFWFYFDGGGYMVDGFQFINGRWYYFSERRDGTRGQMLSNAFLPVGEDGEITV